MVCECIQDPFIGSEAIDRFGLNVQRKSHIKAKHKLQNYEYKTVSFFMSQATFENVKKMFPVDREFRNEKIKHFW